MQKGVRWAVVALGLALTAAPGSSLLLLGTFRKLTLPGALIAGERLNASSESKCVQDCVAKDSCSAFSVHRLGQGQYNCYFTGKEVNESSLEFSEFAFTHYKIENSADATTPDSQLQMTTTKPATDLITQTAPPAPSPAAVTTEAEETTLQPTTTTLRATAAPTTTAAASTTTTTSQSFPLFISNLESGDAAFASQQHLCAAQLGRPAMLTSQAMIDYLIKNFSPLNAWVTLNSSLIWPDGTHYSSTDVTHPTTYDRYAGGCFRLLDTSFLSRYCQVHSSFARPAVCASEPPLSE